MLYFLDLFGVVVFAITGSLVARKKDLDIFGVVVIAFVTAVGGGTLRDVILGNTPVFWVHDPMYVVFSIIGVIVTVILTRFQLLPRRPLLVADAFGLSLFTVIGTQVALTAGTHAVIAIMMGVISSVAGGIIRDILSDEIPLVLRKEIYAIASVAGGTAYIILLEFSAPSVAMIVAMLITLTIRITAIRKGWSLPLKLIQFSADQGA